jgi:hypothetical protein
MEEPSGNKNVALAWFRALLWLMPTAFLVASVISLLRLGFHSRLIGGSMLGWGLLALNLVFTIGTGWFRGRISENPNASAIGLAYQILFFTASQIIIVPLILVFIRMGVFVVTSIRY